MKIVKLKPSEHRRWRANVSLLIDKAGKIVRPMTLREAQVISELQKKAVNARGPLIAEEIDPTAEPPLEGEQPTTIELRVTPHAVKGSTARHYVQTIGEHEVILDRDLMVREVFANHGECQLRSMTGQMMRAIRDTSKTRPLAADANRHAPKPEHCVCLDWGTTPHPGTHHPVCEWNLIAPFGERAPAEGVGTTGGEATRVQVGQFNMPAESQASLDTHASVTVDAKHEQVPAPKDCVCARWAKNEQSVDGQHHNICEWHDRWLTIHPLVEAPRPVARPKVERPPQKVLVSLKTGLPARVAQPDEIEAASGVSGVVEIAGEQFSVIAENELPDRSPSTEQVRETFGTLAGAAQSSAPRRVLDPLITPPPKPVDDPTIPISIHDATPEQLQAALSRATQGAA